MDLHEAIEDMRRQQPLLDLRNHRGTATHNKNLWSAVTPYCCPTYEAKVLPDDGLRCCCPLLLWALHVLLMSREHTTTHTHIHAHTRTHVRARAHAPTLANHPTHTHTEQTSHYFVAQVCGRHPDRVGGTCAKLQRARHCAATCSRAGGNVKRKASSIRVSLS